MARVREDLERAGIWPHRRTNQQADADTAGCHPFALLHNAPGQFSLAAVQQLAMFNRDTSDSGSKQQQRIDAAKVRPHPPQDHGSCTATASRISTVLYKIRCRRRRKPESVPVTKSALRKPSLDCWVQLLAFGNGMLVLDVLFRLKLTANGQAARSCDLQMRLQSSMPLACHRTCSR